MERGKVMAFDIETRLLAAEVAVSVADGDLPSGTCERCDDGMPADGLVRDGDEIVCQPCAEEAEDRRAEKGS